MSITDELREWVTDHYSGWKSKQAEGIAIADRIDAEHERAVVDALLNDGLPMSEEVMAEHGWIRLPKDADGEYVHVGDVIENVVCPSIHREVTGVGVECFYGWDEGNGRYSQFDVNCYRHHHAPTVEDVLREFAERYLDYEGIPSAGRRGVGEALMDEYASKLRMAEGEEA